MKKLKSKECRKCKNVLGIESFHMNYACVGYRTNACKECIKDYNAKRALIKKHNTLQPIKREKIGFSPIKVKANPAVYRAILKGKLIRPCICDNCGNKNKIIAHHCDYSKPLEVNWLCRFCHSDWHILNGEGLNGR